MKHEFKTDPIKFNKMIEGVVRHHATVLDIREGDELIFLSGHRKAVFLAVYVEQKDIFAIASIKLQEWLSPDITSGV